MKLTEEILRTLYYENLFGAANPKRLLQEVKQNGYEAPTLNYLTDFIKNQTTAQQFRRVNPRRLFVPIVGKEYQYQEFRVKYAHLNEEKNKKYEYQLARNFPNNILVNEYRKKHGL